MQRNSEEAIVTPEKTKGLDEGIGGQSGQQGHFELLYTEDEPI